MVYSIIGDNIKVYECMVTLINQPTSQSVN